MVNPYEPREPPKSESSEPRLEGSSGRPDWLAHLITATILAPAIFGLIVVTLGLIALFRSI